MAKTDVLEQARAILAANGRNGSPALSPAMQNILQLGPGATPGLEVPKTDPLEEMQKRAEQVLAAQDAKLDELATDFILNGERPGTTDKLLRLIPDNQRDEFLQKVARQIQERPRVARSFLGKLGQRVRRGTAAISESIEQGAQMIASDPQRQQDLDFVRKTQALRRAADPATAKNLFGRGFLGASEMAPRVLATLAVAPAGALGTVAFWYTQIAPERYNEFRGEGFTSRASKVAASISAIPEALIEVLQVKQLLGSASRQAIKKLVMARTRDVLKQVGIHAGKTYGKEFLEEVAQEGIALATKATLDILDETVTLNYGEQAMQSARQLGEAAIALPFLMGPGHIISGKASLAEFLKINPDAAIFSAAHDLAANDAVKARKIADKESPSRRDVKGTAAEGLTVASDRAKFSAALTGVMAAQEQTLSLGTEQQQQEALREAGVSLAPEQSESSPVTEDAVQPPPQQPPQQPPPVDPNGPRPEGDARPDLANPAVAPEVRDLVDEVDEQRNQEGKPIPVADTVFQSEADQRITADREGERRRLIQTAREGGELGETDTIIAKQLINDEGVAAIAGNDEDAMVAAMQLISAYRDTGTAQGRAFRLRRDPVESPAQRRTRILGEEILTPPKKQREEIQKQERKGQYDEADKIRKQWAKEVAVLKQRLKAMGVDIDNLPDLGADEIKAARAVTTIQAAKSDVWDGIYEYWRNAILSAPTTQAANIIGNTGHAAWHFTAERLIEAMINTGVKAPAGTTWGEFPHILAGILPGLSRGVKNVMRTWKSELNYLEEDIGLKAVGRRLEETSVSIQGKTGRLIRLPQRILLVADEFFKSLIVNMEVGAQAYRIARLEGKEKGELQQRITELTEQIGSEAWAAAMDTTLELVFQSPGGKITEAVLATRRAVPFVRYLIPFVTTPANLFRIGITKSPLGILKLANDIRKDGFSAKGLSATAAQQVIAWAILMMLWDNDPGDPWITGASAQTFRKDRELSRRTFPAQSVRFGGTWYSYARVEPFATSISLTIDLVQGVQKEGAKGLGRAFNSLVGQVKNKTFMQGISDVMKAFESERSQGPLSRWASSFAVSWIPNLVRSAGRATQDAYRQRGIWGQGPEWTSRLMRRTIQKTELGLTQENPIITLWGDEAPREAPFGQPSTDFVWKFVMPIRVKEEDVFVGDRLFVNWNNQHEDNAMVSPMPPRKGMTIKGKKAFMTDDEYERFMRDAGTNSKRRVAAYLADKNVDVPKEKDVKHVKGIISDERAKARRRIIRARRDG